MASTLSVSKIQGLATAASPTTVEIASGHKLTGAAGTMAVAESIVQTQQAIMPQTATTISSTSFVDSGLQVSLTTKLSNSKFLVTISGGGWYDNGNGTQSMWITFQRNSAGGSYDYVTNGYQNNYGLIRMSGDGGTWNIKPYSASIIDSPSVAAGVAMIYKVVVRVNQNSCQFTNADRGSPILQVQEIAQ